MTAPDPGGDFYVGYRTDNASSQGRFTRRITWLLLTIAVGFAALFALLQSPFDAGLFEFGEVRAVTGTLRLDPQPLLQLDQPLLLPASASRAGLESTTDQLLLVEFGKHGVDSGDAALRALDGQAVAVRGSLIAREGIAMLELAEAPRRVDSAPTPHSPDASAARTVRLTGEIVDSKCFLGVMKPGRGKVHRACATLCLDGGVPPAFLVRNADGAEWVALLLDANGRAPRRSLASWVGEAVTLEGAVLVSPGEVPRFRVDLDAQLPLRPEGQETKP